MTDAAEPAQLSEVWAEAIAGFERYLDAERGYSAHTVRAYVGDVSSLVTRSESMRSLPARLSLS